MTQNQMTVFMSVCKTLNMTETARLMHFSQPNVTRIIHEIETEYRVKLFDGTNHLTMTEQGAKIYQYCTDYISRQERLLYSLHEKSNVTEIKIGVLLSISGLLFPAMHIALQAKFPDKIFHYFINDRGRLLSLWEEKKIDIMICNDVITPTVSSCIDIYSDTIAFYKSSQSTIPNTLSLVELSMERLILCETGSALRDQFDDLMRKHGLKSNIFMESGNNALILQMVLKNQGISLLPECIAAPLTDAGVLSRISIPGMLFHMDFFLYSQEIFGESSLFREVIDSIVPEFPQWLKDSNLSASVLKTII